MRTIEKHSLTAPTTEILLARPPEVVSVGIDPEDGVTPVVWLIVFTDDQRTQRWLFHLLPTGGEVTPRMYPRAAGTVHTADGERHVFHDGVRVREDEPDTTGVDEDTVEAAEVE